MRCGTIGSCQSAATSEIGRESDSCKRRYNKYPDLYLYLSSQVIQWCSRNILSRPSQWPRQRLETEARSRQLEILQRQVQKYLFYAVLLTALFNTLARGDLRVICSIKFGFNESMGYSRKTHDPAFICLNSIPACDRRTDRRTDTPTVASTRQI